MALSLRTSAVALAACIAAVAAASGRAADTPTLALAQSLQRHYDGVKDFSASFTHSYQGGVLRKQITERGRLLVKKPGKMRWEYTAPEEKLFVSDGIKMYSYVPQDKQVIVTSVPRDEGATIPALFLAGRGNLIRDFTPSLVQVPAGFPGDVRALKLVPKAAQRDYDWLILVVDPRRLDLRGLVTSDAQGGTSSFSFANLKENVRLADKEFAFKIPRGVDVVTEPSRP